jgi:hypothetical protein
MKTQLAIFIVWRPVQEPEASTERQKRTSVNSLAVFQSEDVFMYIVFQLHADEVNSNILRDI